MSIGDRDYMLDRNWVSDMGRLDASECMNHSNYVK